MNFKGSEGGGPESATGAVLIALSGFLLGAGLTFGLSPATLRAWGATDVGSAAEWFAGIATLLAVSVAIWAAGQSRRERQAIEQREARFLASFLLPEVDGVLQRLARVAFECNRLKAPRFVANSHRPLEEALNQIRLVQTRGNFAKLALLPSATGDALSRALHLEEQLRSWSMQASRLAEDIGSEHDREWRNDVLSDMIPEDAQQLVRILKTAKRGLAEIAN